MLSRGIKKFGSNAGFIKFNVDVEKHKWIFTCLNNYFNVLNSVITKQFMLKEGIGWI